MTANPLKDKTILVADDNEGQLMLLDMVLSSEGYQVALAADGREALQYLKEHTPDLLILDVNMPFLSGIEVCDRVKRIRRLKNVPIMVLTSSRDERVRTTAKMAGANMVMNKPLIGKDLRSIVAALLRGAVARA